MRSIALALLCSVAALLVLASRGPAQSSYRCPGFEPYPPVGCKGPARCACEADGNCRWVFDCDEGSAR
jgi:hypothetical protein